jgi:predicted secreted protein
MDIMCILCPEMMYYKRLPRKQKKALRKDAEQMVQKVVLDRIEQVIKELEIKQ